MATFPVTMYPSKQCFVCSRYPEMCAHRNARVQVKLDSEGQCPYWLKHEPGGLFGQIAILRQRAEEKFQQECIGLAMVME